MAVSLSGATVAVVRLELPLDDFPALLRRHRTVYPNSEALEIQGARLRDGDFAPAETRAFVEGVCRWGKGDRNVGRVLEQNTGDEMIRALREGCERAASNAVGSGVARISKLKRLGQSFASKQLRFLMPDAAVILDSVIRTRLGYAETAAGYEEFLSDCHSILRHARHAEALDAPFRETLRVCDIEAALFAKLQGF